MQQESGLRLETFRAVFASERELLLLLLLLMLLLLGSLPTVPPLVYVPPVLVVELPVAYRAGEPSAAARCTCRPRTCSSSAAAARTVHHPLVHQQTAFELEELAAVPAGGPGVVVALTQVGDVVVKGVGHLAAGRAPELRLGLRLLLLGRMQVLLLLLLVLQLLVKPCASPAGVHEHLVQLQEVCVVKVPPAKVALDLLLLRLLLLLLHDGGSVPERPMNLRTCWLLLQAYHPGLRQRRRRRRRGNTLGRNILFLLFVGVFFLFSVSEVLPYVLGEVVQQIVDVILHTVVVVVGLLLLLYLGRL